MRLLERTLRQVMIAPRETVTDAVGCVVERFSRDRIPARASAIPSTGALERLMPGMREFETMCLLLPPDTPIQPGDGVCIAELDAGEASDWMERPRWRCVRVSRWSAHVAAALERNALSC